MLFRNLLALSLLLASGAVAAQDAEDEHALDEMDRDAPKAAPIVNEPAAAGQLREAMRRIASNTQDSSALIDAGYASLALGDPNAALNFLTKANALRPRDARITAGLGEATVRTENPFEALRLFDDAVRLGIDERKIAFDRGLAFDLLGNFARAQQDYQLARSQGVTDELVIRQAISLSLSGQTNESDAMLDPLLKRGVPEAWRARTFMLGARGDYREASKLAQDFVDPSLLPKTQHYLGLMPKLTGAQQAAALHLGHFPASHQIGHDSEEIKRIAATFPAQGPQAVKGDARLIPSGKPLGAPAPMKKTKEQLKKEKQAAEAAAKEKEKRDKALAKKKADDAKKLASNARRKDDSKPKIPVEAIKVKVPEAKPIKVAQAVPPPASDPRPQSVPPAGVVYLPETARVPVEQSVVVVTPPPAQKNEITLFTPGADVGSAPASSGPAPASQQPGFEVFSQQPSQSPGQPVQTAQSAPFGPADQQPMTIDPGALAGPDEGQVSEVKPAVESVEIAPTKPPVIKPLPAASKAVAGTEARYWVQIATGSESVLKSEFRRLSNKQPEVFSAKQGWTSPWSAKSSRLLVGPFDTLKDAKQWESEFRGGGGDGFAWRNDPGVMVSPLGATAPVKAASKAPVKSTEKPASKQASGKSTAKTGSSKTAAKEETKTSGKSSSKQTNSKTAAKDDSKATGKGSSKQASQQKAKSTDSKSNGKASSGKSASAKSTSGKSSNSKQASAKDSASKSKQTDTKSSKTASSKTASKQSSTSKTANSKSSKATDTKAATAKKSAKTATTKAKPK